MLKQQREIEDLLQRLFPLCRSISGEPNRRTLEILNEIVPISIIEVPTGEKVFDWTIPNEWNVRDAWISDEEGRRVVDFQANNLHLVSYSKPVNELMDWTKLKEHIHVHENLGNAIPYRTTYYREDWGFCLTREQALFLEQYKGKLRVVIDSDLQPGYLTYGEFLIKGKSDSEILISCYICHPSMANDSLSGVVLTALLAKHISTLHNLYWSYRIVFVPETIGAITYCAKNENALRKIDCGLVITTVGGPGKYSYKQSFNSAHPINRLIEQVFIDNRIDFITYPFDIHGSDERQYSSQGFRINMASICRDRYYEYEEYHSSLDNLDFVRPENISQSLHLYCDLIYKLESRRIYKNTIPNCEVMLSRHGLYPHGGGGQVPQLNGRSDLDLILWILFYSDGNLSTEDISVLLHVEESHILSLSEMMAKKGVLEQI